MVSVRNTTITLPNHSSILVKYSGDVKLSSGMVLHDVLYLPEFKFNLLYVGLLSDSGFAFSFFPDHFLIQEILTMKTIGKGS